MHSRPDGLLNEPSAHAALLSLIVKMPAASTIELAGHAGFDLVLIDTEHGPSDMTELEHHVRAADSAGIGTLVRVSDVRSPDILRALDAGASGIVVPHVSRAEDVTHATQLTRYPPHGRRSLALSTRAGKYGTLSIDQHLKAASERVALIAQLEDSEALDHLPEILDSDGLSGIFIGPSDLSASLGHPGDAEHPDVTEAVERIVEEVRARPGLGLCSLANDEREAREWVERGADMVLFNAPSIMAARLTTISTLLKPSLAGAVTA